MRRRDFIKSAAVVSAGAVAGLGGLSQFSRWASAAARSTQGAWSSGLGRPLAQWPLIPIHAVLLGNGQLLTYGTGNDPEGAHPDPTQQTGYFIYDVWDPAAGTDPSSHFTLRNTTGTDIFCSAQIVLPQSGKVLVAGGDNFVDGHTTNTGNNNSTIFDPTNSSLTRTSNMRRARWYATTTTLPDGRIYIQGGSGGSDHPEIRELDGTFRLLTGIDSSLVYPLYPRNHVAPDGRLFGYSNLSMYYVDPNANGGRGIGTYVGEMPADGPRGWTSTDVMYQPGYILRCGGGWPNTEPATNAAALIRITESTPIYRKLSPMPMSLHWPTATVLADGNVVVTGGSLIENVKDGVNTSALLWNAGTRTWTQGAHSLPDKSRLYHSIALLLPDGSVLSGGGGAPGPEANTDAEIYYPPYLFNSSGAFASRPTITSCPAQISYSQTQNFEVGVNSAASIQRVTLIKTGSVTHSVNFEQRFMMRAFSRLNPSTLLVRKPPNPFVAPPGNYLLFVIDSSGVPSIACIVRVS